MNKEYTYIDGKVIISDEFGKQTLSNYYDNLDEVLVSENVIETIEKRILFLEKESKAYRECNSKQYIPIILPITALVTPVGMPTLFYLLGNTNIFVDTINTFFGLMNQAVFFGTVFSIAFIPVAAIFEYGLYRRYKDNLKQEKGINSELEFLRNALVLERERLVELKKENSRTNENKEFRVVSVNDKNRLEALRSWFSLYFDLGYDGEKYYQYYQQGKLDVKLGKNYSDVGINAAKEYLEEKGPTLVRKKTK